MSAHINSNVMDTCEIEGGEKGQFDIFRNGELFLSKEDMGRFPTKEDVDDMIEQLESFAEEKNIDLDTIQRLDKHKNIVYNSYIR